MTKKTPKKDKETPDKDSKSGGGKRGRACGECIPCKRTDCGQCKYCLVSITDFFPLSYQINSINLETVNYVTFSHL